MSLDVHLYGKGEKEPCPECGQDRIKKPELYWANITHNLNKMAEAAGIYEALWRPEEIKATTGAHLIHPLEKGLELLKCDPERFKKYDAPNGWGLYEHFVPFVEKYLEACRNYPEAEVSASR